MRDGLTRRIETPAGHDSLADFLKLGFEVKFKPTNELSGLWKKGVFCHVSYSNWNATTTVSISGISIKGFS